MRRALEAMSAWTAAVLSWTFPWRRLDSEVLALGEVFRGRLSDDVLDDAMEYVGFNERLLAVEILADQLGEYDVRLSRDEWERLIRVYEASGGDPTSRRVFALLEPMRASSGATADPSESEDELYELARAEPDRLYREGVNWMWVGPDGVGRIMCPRCWNGGGGTLSRIRMKGSDDLFYLCDECDALWPVERFEWHSCTVGLMDLSKALDERGLRPDDWEDS